MRRLHHIAVLLVFGALAVPPASAQDTPDYWVHPDYTVRQWTFRDGLPTDEIPHVLPASDSYLWLRTGAGLVRFDGRRFTVFGPSNTPSLTSNPRHIGSHCVTHRLDFSKRFT